jgi:Transposase DDE domain
VTNDIDTLATALYVRADDLLKQHPGLAPWRPAVGLQPRLSDAELVTLAVMQALLGYALESRRLRCARAHLGHLFRYLPGQPGYNRRLRAAAGLITALIRLLAADTSLWADDVWVIDSTPVECGRSRDTARRSDLAGWAEYGYCASHSRYFWGLRLHLVATLGGLPVAFALTGAKADERQTLLAILAADPALAANRRGQTSSPTGTTTAPNSRPPWPRTGCGSSHSSARRHRRTRHGGRCASTASRAWPACLFGGICRGRTGAAAGSAFPAAEDGGDVLSAHAVRVQVDFGRVADRGPRPGSGAALSTEWKGPTAPGTRSMARAASIRCAAAAPCCAA